MARAQREARKKGLMMKTAGSPEATEKFVPHLEIHPISQHVYLFDGSDLIGSIEGSVLSVWVDGYQVVWIPMESQWDRSVLCWDLQAYRTPAP